MPVIGECRLCLRNGVELQDSHFLSKGIYKILRDSNASNPNPFLVTAGKSVQTSHQLKRHLFCKSCEERLNKNGERWVLSKCRQSDGSCPLADVLASRAPNMESPGNPTKIYYCGGSRHQGFRYRVFCGEHLLARVPLSLE